MNCKYTINVANITYQLDYRERIDNCITIIKKGEDYWDSSKQIPEDKKFLYSWTRKARGVRWRDGLFVCRTAEEVLDHNNKVFYKDGEFWRKPSKSFHTTDKKSIDLYFESNDDLDDFNRTFSANVISVEIYVESGIIVAAEFIHKMSSGEAYRSTFKSKAYGKA